MISVSPRRTGEGGRHGKTVKVAAYLTSLVTVASFGAALATGPAGAATPSAISTSALRYTPLSSPMRVADTRAGATDPATYAGKTLSAGTSLTVDIPKTVVPATAGAAVVNITATNPSGQGFLSVYPGGKTYATTSNVNFTKGQTVANLVTVGLGATQSFTVYDGPTTATGGGTVDFTADVEGYYSATGKSAYVATAPHRVYDSRANSGLPGAGMTLGAGKTDNVSVIATKTDGVPSTATGVVLNVGVTNTTASSYLEAYPTGAAPGVATSNQNWVAGETLSSQVISALGKTGQVTFKNYAGTADIVVDVDGYFTNKATTGALFTALAAPKRILTTRTATPLNGGSNSATAITTMTGATATAGVLDVIDLYQGTKAGGNFLTVYPKGTTPPVTANVNYTPSDTYNVVPNAAYGTAGATGDMSVYNGPLTAGKANVVVDEFGYFTRITPPVTNQAYTVTPTTAQTTTVSTTASPNSGDITYTATGLTPNSTVNISLFPCTAPDAPTTTNGTTSFTAPTTTGTPTAGNAQGEGTTTTKEAYIVSVNGAPETTNQPSATAATPTTEDGIGTGTTGTVSFVVNSFTPDCAIPVVYAPNTTSPAHLQVAANGQPTEAFGEGGSATFIAANATAAGIYNVIVQSVNPAAGTFTGTEQTGYGSSDNAVPTGTTLTFSYAGTGNTYYYADPADNDSSYQISQGQFGSYLSGPVASPGTAVPAAFGDQLLIEYNPAASSVFGFDGDHNLYYLGPFSYNGDTYGNGDVPAAPTTLTATANAATTSNGVVTPANITLNWTAPVNPDVAHYNVFRATDTTTNGVTTPGTYSLVASPTSTTYVDTTATTPSTTYSYYVDAVSNTANDSMTGAASNEASATTSAAPAVAPAAAPVMLSVAITPSIPNTATTGSSSNAVAGSASVTYNEAVSCGASSATDFTYSNTNGGEPEPVSGASCAAGTPTAAFAGVKANAGKTNVLVITFPSEYTVKIPVVVVAPVTGDTFTYTSPATPTEGNAVYEANSAGVPTYAASQTLTDTGIAGPVS